MAFYVYMLASQKNGTLYVGHTDDLEERIFDHRNGRGSAFTRKHRLHRLVWVEAHDTRESAKWREYRIKAWKRAWKIELIEKDNPNWDDFFPTLNQ
ncbi:MAG: GIY-YIG nuclease family protein [Hyphomonadaceae bacterium]|nr:GIY-YIG nuclease family protein [Hyphomonadaceae bacterium]